MDARNEEHGAFRFSTEDPLQQDRIAMSGDVVDWLARWLTPSASATPDLRALLRSVNRAQRKGDDRP
jgi:hypothetical protein